MRHQVIRGAVMALALVTGTAATLSAQSATPEAKAAEVLAATRKAIGDKKLDAMKTFSVGATMQRNLGSMQMQTEVEVLMEMPDKYIRSDVSSGPMTMSVTTGFNGEKAIMPSGARVAPGGGMIITMGNAPAGAMPHDAGEKPTPEQLEQLNKSSLRNYRQEISRLTLGWFGAAHPSLKTKYTYAGEAESPDGKAHVIDVKDEDGFSARLFIDQVSHLPLMVTYQGRQGRMTTNMRPGAAGPGGAQVMTRSTDSSGATTTRAVTPEEAKKLADQIAAAVNQPAPMVEFSLFFEDWKEVDGINFPHKIRRASGRETNEEWTINKVKVNPKIDAKKFAVPEGK